MPVKQFIKDLLVRLDLPLTKNQRYDSYTLKILDKILKPDSNCVDIGCHKGEILDTILKFSPDGRHYAFEPIPYLFNWLKEKYKAKNIFLFSVALFDSKGETSFHHVINAPAYSGIRRRKYATKDVRVVEMTVETDILDNIIPETETIDFIKIDVEGAEYGVLRGSLKTMKRCKPTIIFEFGLGAADYYGIKPEALFSLVTEDCEMQISTLHNFLKGSSSLKMAQFCDLYQSGKEYYFVAHSPSPNPSPPGEGRYL
jgi:FkbM family methyltransferase